MYRGLNRYFILVATLLLAFSGKPLFADDDIFNDFVRNEPDLKAQELKDVMARKVIYHANPSGLPGGRATAFVQATPQQAFNAATDFEHYTEFIPGTLVMNVLNRDEKTASLHGEYKSTWPYSKIILESTNYFDMSDPNHIRVVWKSTKTNMKEAFGFWIMKAQENGTLMTYSMEFDLDWIPHFVAAHNGRERVIEIVEAARNRAEKKNQPSTLQAEKK